MPRGKTKEHPCSIAIKKTLAYRAIFKYPLSFHQLSTFLIANCHYDRKTIQKEVGKLIRKGFIKKKNGRYMLSTTLKPIDWSFRFKHSRRLIKRNKRVFDTLKTIPWIRFIGVTGSAAACNAEKDTDVDIFIITQRRRLWLTRFFLFIFLKLLKKYPSQKSDRGKICPNILIDEEALTWPKEKQNVYIAHEIALMQPIFDRGNTYFKFLRANNWISDYLYNFKLDEIYLPPAPHGVGQSRFVDLLEKIFMFGQQMYMKKRRTTEIITKNFVHFNKNDSTQRILNSYFERTSDIK